MTDSNLDIEVRTLTLQLQQLRVEQERLEQQLSRVQHKLKRQGRKSAEGNTQGAVKSRSPSAVPLHVPSQVFEQSQDKGITRNSIQVREYTYSQTVTPEKGDYVRILNPRKGQYNVGIIIDFCNNGKVIFFNWRKYNHNQTTKERTLLQLNTKMSSNNQDSGQGLNTNDNT